MVIISTLDYKYFNKDAEYEVKTEYILLKKLEEVKTSMEKGFADLTKFIETAIDAAIDKNNKKLGLYYNSRNIPQNELRQIAEN